MWNIQNYGKTLRISDDSLHRLFKIQGEIQAKSGEFTSMDDVIAGLVKLYRKRKYIIKNALDIFFYSKLH